MFSRQLSFKTVSSRFSLFTPRCLLRFACIIAQFIKRVFLRFWNGHWVVTILGIYIASRIVTTILVLIVSTNQQPTFAISHNPDYFAFANIWDARWYESIVYFGYPKVLPTNAFGYVGQNAWAFLPGYPIAVKLVMFLFGLGFQKAAVAISLIFGFLTCIVMYLLQRSLFSRDRAMLCVLLFAFNPLSPLFQFGYADTYSLFFVLLALWFLRLREYALLVAVLPGIAFSRPIALAFALGLILLFLMRCVKSRQGKEEFPKKDFISLLIASVVAVILGFVWPVIAGIFSGRLDAYLATELSWRIYMQSDPHFAIFQPWFLAFYFYATYFGMPGWIGILTAAVIILILLFVLFCYIRRLGDEIFSWSAAYIVYILAVFFPQSSVFRIALPLSPALVLLARRKSVVIIFLVLSVILQFVWLDVLWVISPGGDPAPP